ncbi:MAG: 1-deoxy-D-xylulose-5-phosphate reductoisomerase [Deltaproteobacteria bacterium HGW-Deltaproteobacteria-1]|nr:MAG: 1-deoxy-D-xylulose-5-phosphate reductoisomerase [Deltaproteobacteria bacterium HGW-Deltaproteobacteria-1]
MKKITILGSTGSIGVSTLDVIEKNPRAFKVTALVAGRNVKLLAQQIVKFKPEIVAVSTGEDAAILHQILGFKKRIPILYDEKGIEEVASYPSSDIVLSAISGAAGLRPTLAAIEAGRDVALANKETMVIAGHIVTRRAKQKKIKILPVDSEHSAIFQCLAGQRAENLRRILLTASGGPFYNLSRAELKKVTLEQALRHPRWKMGSKITIDSASLMNKGLEVIEAKWLFDMDIARIDVLIHPQSVVHSMIEIRSLEFFKPDMKKFPCLGLAYEAGRLGGTAPVVLNAANETAVASFTEKKICFNDLPKVIEKVMDKHQVKKNPSLDDILGADREARIQAGMIVNKLRKR